MAVKERLIKGAKMLGDFWRAGERCAEGWRVFGPDADPAYAAGCACEPKSRFCKAKAQWLALAREDGREPVVDNYGLAVMMTGLEWDATGWTFKVDIPETGVVSVGPKGVLPKDDMLQLTPESLPSFLRLLKAFPGSRVTEAVFSGVPVQPEQQFPPEAPKDGTAEVTS